MPRRWIALAATAGFLITSIGCEITASAYVQQEYNTNPRVFDKPDGLVKAEIKVSRLVGKDGVK
jgi:hypothetical protein